MRKAILSAAIFSVILLAATAILLQTGDPESEQETLPVAIEPDVIMPTKVSRPGCEETDSCYVPSMITVKKGQQVTWSNGDVAFHSVTSGVYGEPSGLFDSGHLDPQEQFSVAFEEEGSFDYFCTLHPWMKGQVVVG